MSDEEKRDYLRRLSESMEAMVADGVYPPSTASYLMDLTAEMLFKEE